MTAGRHAWQPATARCVPGGSTAARHSRSQAFCQLGGGVDQLRCVSVERGDHCAHLGERRPCHPPPPARHARTQTPRPTIIESPCMQPIKHGSSVATLSGQGAGRTDPRGGAHDQHAPVEATTDHAQAVHACGLSAHRSEPTSAQSKLSCVLQDWYRMPEISGHGERPLGRGAMG
jgi:hypothetical protein